MVIIDINRVMEETRKTIKDEFDRLSEEVNCFKNEFSRKV